MTKWLRKLDLYFGLFLLILLGAWFFLTVNDSVVDESTSYFFVAKADLEALAEALELYRKDHGDYPATEDMPTALVKNRNGAPSYLDKFPIDPWRQPYIYKRTSGAAHPYILYSTGANRVDEHGLGDDLDYWKVKVQIHS